MRALDSDSLTLLFAVFIGMACGPDGIENTSVHVLRAFGVRDGRESIEWPAAFAMTHFWVEGPADPGAFDAIS